MRKTSAIQQRHAAIKKLVQQYLVEDQQQLSDLLNEHFGIKSNQAIMSRDLRALGITKVIRQGKSVYEFPNKDIYVEILKLGILDVEYNESLVVIKTLAGLADFVGDYLDTHENEGILGTLAGENMIFVTPVSGIAMPEFYKSICQLTQFKIDESKEK